MKILIIEDDKILSETIKQVIQDEYEVSQEYDGESGLFSAKLNIYDLIILDLMLPEMNGYEVLNKLRAYKIYTPVLILTARDDINDKVKGLKIGADDYLVKPFESEELLARIDAIIRRTNGNYTLNNLKFKNLEMNLNSRNVTINGEEIILQGKQFEILEYLINYKNKIITKEQIFDKIWGFNSETTTNVVEVYTSGLRRILKKYDYDKYLKTIRGVGYMLVD